MDKSNPASLSNAELLHPSLRSYFRHPAFHRKIFAIQAMWIAIVLNGPPNESKVI